MPPKRKDSATAPAASGPKQKRSKTSFRTPTTADLESTQAGPSELGSTKNRVVTLRASASGRRGYRSQDLSTASSSSANSESLNAENLVLPSDDTANSSDSIPPLNLESEQDLQPGPTGNSSAKSRPKQKNTTTVRLNNLTTLARHLLIRI
jgi:hypothetical protein